ncbi:hypothetical protein VUR80DRAFT_514 [Thermomyces stellatus]
MSDSTASLSSSWTRRRHLHPPPPSPRTLGRTRGAHQDHRLPAPLGDWISRISPPNPKTFIIEDREGGFGRPGTEAVERGEVVGVALGGGVAGRPDDGGHLDGRRWSNAQLCWMPLDPLELPTPLDPSSRLRLGDCGLPSPCEPFPSASVSRKRADGDWYCDDLSETPEMQLSPTSHWSDLRSMPSLDSCTPS